MNLSDSCKKQLVGMLYQIIADWSHLKGYKRPPMSWLTGHCFNFLKVKSYSSTYNGVSTNSIGTYKVNDKKIVIACDRRKKDVMRTVVHELAHAVQKYNFKDLFSFVYNAEIKRSPTHDENKYEVEANAAEALFDNAYLSDASLRDAVLEFEYDFANPKKCRETLCHYFYSPEIDYWNEPRFKSYRKSWWLRR